MGQHRKPTGGPNALNGDLRRHLVAVRVGGGSLAQVAIKSIVEAADITPVHHGVGNMGTSHALPACKGCHFVPFEGTTQFSEFGQYDVVSVVPATPEPRQGFHQFGI